MLKHFINFRGKIEFYTCFLYLFMTKMDERIEMGENNKRYVDLLKKQ
jgi:hypothetical protein